MLTYGKEAATRVYGKIKRTRLQEQNLNKLSNMIKLSNMDGCNPKKYGIKRISNLFINWLQILALYNAAFSFVL